MDTIALRFAVSEGVRAALAKELAPGWLTVNKAAMWCGVSQRTIRAWVARTVDPLPCSRPGGGKILVNRGALDAWLSRQRAGVDLDRIASEVVAELGGGS